jgi:hypothetical protein
MEEVEVEVLELLEAGRKIISEPRAWTQHAFARNARGHQVPSGFSEATCWCSVGVLNVACNSVISKVRRQGFIFEYMEDARSVLDAFAEGCIAEYNDTHTHEEVMSLWDKAIISVRNGRKEQA